MSAVKNFLECPKGQENQMKATANRKAAKNQKATAKAASKAQPKEGLKAAKAQIASQTNPYRVNGGYWASVEALRALGLGKMHSHAAILAAYRKVLGAAAWKAFAAVEPRNKKTGKDADGRALQNVSVVARADYGKPLKALGFEVRWDGREKVAGLFRAK